MRYRTRIELLGQGHMDFPGMLPRDQGTRAVEVESVVVAKPAKVGGVQVLDTAALVYAVKLHAQANYERNGWDFVVEAWEDSDIEESIKGAKTVAGAIAKVASAVKCLAEHRQEVIAS